MILFDHIHYLLTPDKSFCRELKHMLGFYPHNPDIYHEAFRHRSISGRSENEKKQSNERLEYLGDAVLSSIVAEVLYKHFPTKHEGFLTKARSAIVQRSTLNHIATDMGIESLVKKSIGSPSHNSFVLGNAFEALIGAICIDRGYRFCQRFVKEKVIAQYNLLEKLAIEDTNYKSQLIEYCQKHQYPIEFTTIDEMISEGSPLFESNVTICGINICSGKGYTKKESHQQAAYQALRLIHNNQKILNTIREKWKQMQDAADETTSTETSSSLAAPSEENSNL